MERPPSLSMSDPTLSSSSRTAREPGVALLLRVHCGLENGDEGFGVLAAGVPGVAGEAFDASEFVR